MDLEKLINMLIKEKGGTSKQYHLFMDKVAHHESKGKNVRQVGGPGRGLFQFEEGEGAGGKTAANRLITYLKGRGEAIPTWLKETQGAKSLNAMNLTPIQQKMLFLGNLKEHPTADFSKLWKGEESEEDFWAKYHWAGDKADVVKRRKSFRHSAESFKPQEYSTPTQDRKIEHYWENPPKYSPIYKQQNNIKLEEPSKAVSQVTPDTTNYNLDLMKFDLSQPKDVNQITQPQESSYTQYANNHNIAAMGGHLAGNNEGVGEFNSFNTGGTHEQNPLGGIPQGQDNNGVPNTVEEGETSYKFKDGKYIFSNRIKI